MAAKEFRFGPIALTTTMTTNLLNPGTTTGGVNASSSPYDKTKISLRHIRIVNKTAGAVTFSLWLGLTGANTAGTEVIGQGLSVAANSAYDWYAGAPGLVLHTVDFLVGGASANTSLSIQGEGTVEVS
jgi:hypothetical protein